MKHTSRISRSEMRDQRRLHSPTDDTKEHSGNMSDQLQEEVGQQSHAILNIDDERAGIRRIGYKNSSAPKFHKSINATDEQGWYAEHGLDLRAEWYHLGDAEDFHKALRQKARKLCPTHFEHIELLKTQITELQSLSVGYAELLIYMHTSLELFWL